jgi:hypothetical protein
MSHADSMYKVRNKSDVGRQRNRRIEIILEPDLRKLPLDALHATQER